MPIGHILIKCTSAHRTMKPLFFCSILFTNTACETTVAPRVDTHDSLAIVPGNECTFATVATINAVKVRAANMAVLIVRVDRLPIGGMAALACWRFIQREAGFHGSSPKRTEEAIEISGGMESLALVLKCKERKH